MKIAPFICVFGFVFITMPVAAQTSDIRDGSKTIIAIDDSESREVSRNFVRVDLTASANGNDVSILAGAVDTTVNLLVQKTTNVEGVEAIVGSRAAVVEDISNTKLWHVGQTMIIQGVNFNSITNTIHNLPPGIVVENISYSVPVNVQRRAENDLTTDALKYFMERANLVKSAIGAKAFRVDKIEIKTTNSTEESNNCQGDRNEISNRASAPNSIQKSLNEASNSPSSPSGVPFVVTTKVVGTVELVF